MLFFHSFLVFSCWRATRQPPSRRVPRLVVAQWQGRLLVGFVLVAFIAVRRGERVGSRFSQACRGLPRPSLDKLSCLSGVVTIGKKQVAFRTLRLCNPPIGIGCWYTFCECCRLLMFSYVNHLLAPSFFACMTILSLLAFFLYYDTCNLNAAGHTNTTTSGHGPSRGRVADPFRFLSGLQLSQYASLRRPIRRVHGAVPQGLYTQGFTHPAAGGSTELAYVCPSSSVS